MNTQHVYLKLPSKEKAIIDKANFIVYMVELLPDLPKEISSAIKTFKFLQAKAFLDEKINGL